MFGLVEREPGSTRNFNPADGSGHVAPSTGDYDFAIAKGHDVRLLLVETYGGFGTDLNRLFRAAAHSQANALSKAQLDDQASWSTRSWTALQGQRLSLAIQFAVAYEIINELGYGDGAATTAARPYSRTAGPPQHTTYIFKGQGSASHPTWSSQGAKIVKIRT